MHILLNGDRKELPGPLTVRALLETLAIDARVVAVEVDRAVVRRRDHDHTVVTDGSEVEIVSFVGGGAMRAFRRHSLLALFLVVGWSALSGHGPVAAQGQTSPAQKPVLTDETLVVYNGWAKLAAGDLDGAVSYAMQILNKYPQSIAGASLLIEAEIVRGGGMAGLNAYERWLGARRLEDGYLLRRAARGTLWDAARVPEVYIEALQILARDGDLEAQSRLLQQMNAGSPGETRALAKNGNEDAVRRLIDQIEKQPGEKVLQINALVDSRSPLAVPTLTKLLDDRNRPGNMAAAAEGLGTLGARSAIQALRRLVQDQSTTGSVRLSAAVGLYRMNDMAGLDLLKKFAASEEPSLRAYAAGVMAPTPSSGPPDPAWLKTVRELAASADPVARVRAAALLAPYDVETARQTLERLLTDNDEPVREMAAKAMAENVATDFLTFRRLMRASSPLTRIRAADRVLLLTR